MGRAPERLCKVFAAGLAVVMLPPAVMGQTSPSADSTPDGFGLPPFIPVFPLVFSSVAVCMICTLLSAWRTVRQQAQVMRDRGVHVEGIVVSKRITQHRGSKDRISTSHVVVIRFDAKLPSGEPTGVVTEQTVTSLDHAGMIPGSTRVKLIYDPEDVRIAGMADGVDRVLDQAGQSWAAAAVPLCMLSLFFSVGVAMSAFILTQVSPGELSLATGLAVGLGILFACSCGRMGCRVGRAQQFNASSQLVPVGAGAAADAVSMVGGTPGAPPSAAAKAAPPAASGAPPSLAYPLPAVPHMPPQPHHAPSYPGASPGLDFGSTAYGGAAAGSTPPRQVHHPAPSRPAADAFEL